MIHFRVETWPWAENPVPILKKAPILLTNPDGVLIARGLPPGQWKLSAHFHHTIFSQGILSVYAPPGHMQSIACDASRGISIRGVVVDDVTGSPVTSGVVTFGSGLQEHYPWYPVSEDGSFMIAGLSDGGEYLVTYLDVPWAGFGTSHGLNPVVKRQSSVTLCSPFPALIEIHVDQR
jgi:hypothetical protein